MAKITQPQTNYDQLNAEPIEKTVARLCASALRQLQNNPSKFDESRFRNSMNRVLENIQRTSTAIQRFKNEGGIDRTILSALEAYEKGQPAPAAYKGIFSPKK